jgi:hypothetical protein
METPYGEIPDRFVRDMGPQEMHDFLEQRYKRRNVLRGAAVLGLAAVTSPVLWRQAGALAATTPIGPRWIAFGPDPASQMYLSWSAGTAKGTSQAPPAPQVRWGLGTSYGSVQDGVSAQVPVPAAVHGEPAENTFYSNVLLSGLAPGTIYHYSVSNDGATWSADATFTTAAAGLSNFRFTAFGDEAASTNSAAMVRLVASLNPAFHLVAGDLAYATATGLKIPDVTGFNPAQWDKYLGVIGPNGAQSIPWQASVGAHEVEPLNDNGYAGFVTRFPQPYDLTSGSPVVHTFTYGNVAFIHLDANDLSAQETVNTGYTNGAQTAWLAGQLAGYRSAGTGIDFVVVVLNCCCYSSNRNHGSDGGVRDAWGPLFDQYQVDLVISGHVHAYERTNPMRAGQPTRQVASGGTVNPPVDGTTYICAGGGGNGLYKTWYGPTGAGDAGNSVAPKVWRWSGGDTASGGSGKPQDLADTAQGFSAFRRAVYSCLVIDVTAPSGAGGQTSMLVRALMPAQTSTVTSIASPAVMDSVSLVRTS